MPPVVVAVAAAAASFGAAGLAAGTGIAALAAGSLGATLIGSAAALAVSTAGNAIFAKKGAGKPSMSQTARDRTVSVRQAISPRQIVYGNVKVGGTIVYLQSTDNNKYLHLVVALAGHELAEIGDIYFDDVVVPLDVNGYVTAGSQFYNVGSHLAAADKPRVRIKKYPGTATQTADADLIAASGGKWTTAHRGQGVAYIYVRLTWDSAAFPSGIPNITAVVKGKKVFDPRSATTAYSDNAALCIRDYLLTPVKDGGVGALSTELDATNWIAAANLCDELVPVVGTSTTEKRYTLNGTIALSDSNTPKGTLENLLTSCGGTLVYAGGKWRLLAAAYRTPAVTLTESDLRGGIQMTTRVSRREQYNAVKGTFISPDNKWQPADYPAVISTTAMAEDGGERIFREVDRPFTTSAARAQRLGKIELLRGRQPITIQMPCKLTAFRVQAGDVVNVTNARFGWVAKPFEVREWQFALSDDGMLGIDLSLRETDISAFDWATSEEQTVDPAPNTLLPDWRNVAAPDDLSVNSANSEVITGTDGTLISRVMVSWTASTDAFVSKYEVQYRIVGQTGWAYRSETTSTTFVIDNIPVGTAIDVQVRAVNSLGNYSNFVTIFAHTVTGYSTRANPAVTGLKVVGSAGGAPGVFNTRDVSFQWDAHSIGVLFDAYVVEIRNVGTNTLRRTFTTKTAGFLYDLASNVVDGLSRTFIVSVQVRNVLGALSTAATLTATNAAPALPTGITLEGDFRTIRLRYTPPAEEDWAGILVWSGTSSGFTPGDANKVYQGPDTLVVWGADPGVTRYVRYAAYDVFGVTGLNVSGESVVSTTRISHADLMAEVIDSTSLFPDLQARINLIDAPGTGLVTQVSQIASGVGGNTAAVETAMSAIDGLEARYTVKVDVNGYVAGYGIAASANDGAPTSDFIVSADRFSIAKPGVGGLSPTIPFIVSTKGSTPVLSFNGYASFSKILSGTIDTEQLFIGGANVILDGVDRNIRVSNGTADQVRMGQLSPGVYGIEIRDATGSLVLSSAGGVPVSKVYGLGPLATASTVNWDTQLVNVPAFGNFAYLSGITSANISTYIAGAAIGTAYISDLSATKLTAGDVDAQGINVRGGALDVYDGSTSSLRVRIGHWPGRSYGIHVRDPATGNMIAEFSNLQNYLNGAVIDDLTVTTAKIANLAINGTKIEDLAASNSAGASSSTNVASVGLTCTGKPVTIIGTSVVRVVGLTTNNEGQALYNTASATVAINHFGTQIKNVAAVSVYGSDWRGTASIMHTFTPAAGWNEFHVIGSGGSHHTSIWVIENRK